MSRGVLRRRFAWLRHGWPRSLRGQLMAVVVLGVLAAHALALLVTWQRSTVLNPVSQAQVVERMVVAYRVAQSGPVDDGFSSMLWAVSTEDARFWIEDVDSRPLRPMTERELGIAQALAHYLPGVPFDDINVQLADGPGLGAAGRSGWGWSQLELNMALPLPNGQWLYGYQQPLAGYQWMWLLGYSLPASTLPILLIVLIFIYRIVRPLRKLATAAERVSRGERVELVDAAGPQETRELAQAFNTMQHALLGYVDDRTRMLAAISHDFRTPITSLRLRAELLPAGKARDAMIRILDGMQRMVGETLRFARDDAVHEATEPLDLNRLLEELVDDARQQGRQIDWRPTAGASAYRARPLALRRALQNVLDNALRHGRHVAIELCPSPAGPNAESTAGRQNAPAMGWAIHIDDDGPGIDPQLLEQVFVPFFQVDGARNHQGGGVGLGLSIARSCVQAHGGSLQLSNRPQGGLRATLYLP